MRRWCKKEVVFFCVCAVALLGCGASPLAKGTPVDFDVIVVGSGMGGLSAAAHLASSGKKVLVLEQNHEIGGCTSSFERDDFKFDIALHELSLGGGDGMLRKLFEKAGIHDRVELIRIPDLGRTIYPGLDFVFPGDLEATVHSLKKKWPKEEKNIDAFFALMEKMNEEVVGLRDLYFANPVSAAFKKLAVPFKQRTLAKHRNDTLQEIMDEYFEDDRLKTVLSAFWVYHGPPPSEQWGLINLVANYSYIKNGAWQIKGSSHALARAYASRVTELGGEVRTGALVTKINVTDGQVRGVTLESNQTITSRYVVSNADPHQTFTKLLDRAHVSKRVLKQVSTMEPSNSFVGVYIGLDVPISHFGVNEYEIFYHTSWDYDAMYKASMEGRFKEGFITLTLYSNLDDPFYAPEGKSVVVLNAYSDIDTWPPRGDAYYKQKDEMISDLIDMAENVMPGLREHIVVAEGMTPRTIEMFTLNRDGVPYGWNFTPEQQDRFPIPTDIAGLYLAGAWVWPAHSVSMAQVSGFVAARLIVLEDENN